MNLPKPLDTARFYANATMVLFGLYLFSNLLALLFGAPDLYLKFQAMKAQSMDPMLEFIFNLGMGLIGLSQLLVLLALVVAYSLWIYHAHKTLGILNVSGLRFTAGWAVAYFFIPILNLFRPYQVVSQLWRASNPDDDDLNNPESTTWKSVPPTPLLGWWWGLWLFSNLVDNATLRMGFLAEPSPTNDLYVVILSLFSNLVSIPLCILAFLLVQQINRRQLERYNRLTIASVKPDNQGI